MTGAIPSCRFTPMCWTSTFWVYFTTSSSSSDRISTFVIPRFSQTSAIFVTSAALLNQSDAAR